MIDLSSVLFMNVPLRRRRTALAEVEELVSKFPFQATRQSQKQASSTIHDAARQGEDDKVEGALGRNGRRPGVSG